MVDPALLALGLKGGAPAATEDPVVRFDRLGERVPRQGVEFCDGELHRSHHLRCLIDEPGKLGGRVTICQ